MNDYQKLLVENQRLLILQALLDAPAYSANEFLIQAHLINNGLGLGLSDLTLQIKWLSDHDLIKVAPLSIKLKQNGLDAAKKLNHN